MHSIVKEIPKLFNNYKLIKIRPALKKTFHIQVCFRLWPDAASSYRSTNCFSIAYITANFEHTTIWIAKCHQYNR